MKFSSKPFKNKDDFRRFYHHEAKSYDNVRSSDFEGRYIDSIELNLVLRHVNEIKKPKILDCGCGTGRIIIPLAKRGLNCSGIDASKNMLGVLKNKAGPLSKKIDLRFGDIENMPYKNETFDCVYSFKVVMHLNDWECAFREMYRVTKKGGFVIFDVLNVRCPWRILSLHKSTRAYRIRQFNKLLKDHPTRVVALYSYPSFSYRVPVVKHSVPFFEKYLPFPGGLRRKFVFVVQKC